MFFRFLLFMATTEFHKYNHLKVSTSDRLIRKCRMIDYIVNMIIEDNPEEENVFLNPSLDLNELYQIKNPLF